MDTQDDSKQGSDLRGSDLMELGTSICRDVEDVLKRGRVRRVKLKLGDRVLLDVPVTVGAASALALAVGAVVLSRLRVEIEAEQNIPEPSLSEPSGM